jgi:hypothetical protein
MWVEAGAPLQHSSEAPLRTGCVVRVGGRSANRQGAPQLQRGFPDGSVVPRGYAMESCSLRKKTLKCIYPTGSAFVFRGDHLILPREETAPEGLIAKDKKKQVDDEQQARATRSTAKSQRACAAEVVACHTSKPVTVDLEVISRL